MRTALDAIGVVVMIGAVVAIVVNALGHDRALRLRQEHWDGAVGRLCRRTTGMFNGQHGAGGSAASDSAAYGVTALRRRASGGAGADYQHLRYVVMTMRKEIASSGLSGPQGRDSKYRPAEEPFGLAAIVKLMVAIPILSVAFSALLSGNHELAMKLVKAVPVP